MKIQIHSMTLDGKPIPEGGKIIQASTCLEAAERMRYQTPFTADQTLREYLLSVLSNIEPDSGKPLPDNPEEAAAEFFTRMAQHGWVEFIADEIEIDPDPENRSAIKCADK